MKYEPESNGRYKSPNESECEDGTKVPKEVVLLQFVA
jgi:hypothetical protein